MPISYAVGYALSSDYDEPPTMRELFPKPTKHVHRQEPRKDSEAAGPQREER